VAEYGLVSIAPNTTYNNSLNRNFGWGFTVGASDIALTGLRVRIPSAITAAARLYRKSDAVMLAEKFIAVGAGAVSTWVEGELDAPVTLVAGTEYVVAIRAQTTIAQRDNPATTAVFSDAITLMAATSWLIVADTMPTSGWGANIMGLVDIVFTR